MTPHPPSQASYPARAAPSAVPGTNAFSTRHQHTPPVNVPDECVSRHLLSEFRGDRDQAQVAVRLLVDIRTDDERLAKQWVEASTVEVKAHPAILAVIPTTS